MQQLVPMKNHTGASVVNYDLNSHPPTFMSFLRPRSLCVIHKKTPINKLVYRSLVIDVPAKRI